jgi:hypothetical protein
MRTPRVEYSDLRDGRWSVEGVIQYEWQKLNFLMVSDLKEETRDTFYYLLPKIKCLITYFIN